MSTVAVDFDGVIHAYSRGWGDGTIYDEPVPGALKALRTLLEEHAVFVFTSRDPQQVADWLRERGVEARTLYDLRMVEGLSYSYGTFWDRRDVILVTDRKLPAIAYIDDRAVRFRNWAQALQELAHVEGAATPAVEAPAELDRITIDRLFPDDGVKPDNKYDLIREVIATLGADGYTLSRPRV